MSARFRLPFAAAMTSVLLQSCTTLLLWGGDPFLLDDEEDDHLVALFGTSGAGYRDWPELLYKVPLTPVTVVFDIGTLPFQLVYRHLLLHVRKKHGVRYRGRPYHKPISPSPW